MNGVASCLNFEGSFDEVGIHFCLLYAE